jgi:hypothetical protein
MENFTAQREALMRIQELVQDFSEKLLSEYGKQKAGGDGQHHYSDKLVIGHIVETREITAILERIGPLAEQLRANPEREGLRQELQHCRGAIKQYNRQTAVMIAALRENAEFMGRFLAITQELLLIHIPRTGSQLVATDVWNYIQAVEEYVKGDRLITKDADKLVSNVADATVSLQFAIGNALKEGPFAA